MNYYDMSKIRNTVINFKDDEGRVNRIPLYLDLDGVIFDTNRYIRNLLLEQYGIDKWTHKRENIEDDKKVAEFFKNFDWCEHFEKIPQINGNSFKALDALIDCGTFEMPTIFSACSSHEEKYIKAKFISKRFPRYNCLFIYNNHPKRLYTMGDDPKKYFRILVDDDPYNLNSWKKEGISIPFNGGNPNINYPTMENLEELFWLFRRVHLDGQEFVPGYTNNRDWDELDLVAKFDINPKTGYLETKTMRENFEKKLLLKK